MKQRCRDTLRDCCPREGGFSWLSIFTYKKQKDNKSGIDTASYIADTPENGAIYRAKGQTVSYLCDGLG